jgi:formate dehydrogenase maturation protein FdhE
MAQEQRIPIELTMTIYDKLNRIQQLVMELRQEMQQLPANHHPQQSAQPSVAWWNQMAQIEQMTYVNCGQSQLQEHVCQTCGKIH